MNILLSSDNNIDKRLLLVFANCFIVFHNHTDKRRGIQGRTFQVELKNL